MVRTNKVASAYMILFYLSPLQINPAVKSNKKKKSWLIKSVTAQGE